MKYFINLYSTYIEYCFFFYKFKTWQKPFAAITLSFTKNNTIANNNNNNNNKKLHFKKKYEQIFFLII